MYGWEGAGRVLAFFIGPVDFTPNLLTVCVASDSVGGRGVDCLRGLVMIAGSFGLIGTVAAREDTQPKSQVDGAADLSDPLPGTRTSDRDRSLNSPGATILSFTSLTFWTC